MAAGSAIAIYHGTLVAATQDNVTLTGGFHHNVEVVNRGSADIFVTAGGSSASTPAATVGGAETWVAPAGQTTLIPVTSGVQLEGAPDLYNINHPSKPLPTQTFVNLISSGTPSYSVVGS